MNERCLAAIQLSLDCKKNRLRIHKATFPLIGNPKYLQLLVNPEAKQLALRGVDRELKQCTTIKITYRKGSPDSTYELYSNELISELKQLFPDLNPSTTHHLPGRIYPDEQLVVFSLTEITPVK